MGSIIICHGQLDYVDGDNVWLIRDKRLGTRVLDGLLIPHIGQTITIYVGEPEGQSLEEQLTKPIKHVLQASIA